MTRGKNHKETNTWKIWVFWAVCFLVLVIAVIIAYPVQTDFGKVLIFNVYYKNYNGKNLRAKLFKPKLASKNNPLPGMVFIHSY